MELVLHPTVPAAMNATPSVAGISAMC